MTTIINPADATARLGLPFLYPAQAQKEFLVNEALARLDTLVQPMVHGIAAAPPDAAEAGDCWIVGGTAGGAFAEWVDALAAFDGTRWSFTKPLLGMLVFDRSVSAMRRFSGAWSEPVAVAPPSGGTVVDAEARQAIVAIMQALRGLSLLKES